MNGLHVAIIPAIVGYDVFYLLSGTQCSVGECNVKRVE